MTEFSLVELDLLATYAGVPMPFPIRVPSHGHTLAERTELLTQAGHALQERGLAADHGPVGIAQELVTALREHTAAVDIVGEHNAVAMVYGIQAVVCRQADGKVHVSWVDAAELSDELARYLADARAAQTMPVTVPATDPRVAGLRPTGQIGVTRRGTRQEVSWMDGPDGRVRIDQGADGWVSVNPVRRGELVRALGELAAIARQ